MKTIVAAILSLIIGISVSYLYLTSKPIPPQVIHFHNLSFSLPSGWTIAVKQVDLSNFFFILNEEMINKSYGELLEQRVPFIQLAEISFQDAIKDEFIEKYSITDTLSYMDAVVAEAESLPFPTTPGPAGEYVRTNVGNVGDAAEAFNTPWLSQSDTLHQYFIFHDHKKYRNRHVYNMVVNKVPGAESSEELDQIFNSIQLDENFNGFYWSINDSNQQP